MAYEETVTHGLSKNKRFIKTYTQVGLDQSIQIWVDKETGVNYLHFWRELGGSTITPLLDPDGKPIVTHP